MKPKGRYNNADEILKRIDVAKAEIADCEQKGSELITLARDLIHSGRGQLAQDSKDEANRLFRRADRITNSTLPRLKARLAELNTLMLPIDGIQQDASVSKL